MAPRLRYFVSTDSQPRARRAVDAFTAGTGLLLLAWGVYGVDRLSPYEAAVRDLLPRLPNWLVSIATLGFSFGLVFVVLLVAAMVRNRRVLKTALRDVVVAVGGAAALAIVFAHIVEGDWPRVLPELGLTYPAPWFPNLRVAVVVGALIAASPHLGRPMRRLSWITAVFTTVSAAILGYGELSDVFGAAGIGMLAGGSVLLAVGSPRGYPDPASVADALRGMGLETLSVRIDPEQTWGVRRLVADTPDGSVLAIKAYGRDASDSMRIAKAWRTLWYRERRRAMGYSRLQAVEHEALVTMMAGRAGVRVSEVIAAGQTSSEIALLVLGGGLATLRDTGRIDDGPLEDLWRDVARLHAMSISHGALTTDAVLVDDEGRHLLTDFSVGSLVADDFDRMQDIVELLFSLSLLVGPGRAVASAMAGLGNDGLTAALPYLQLPAISSGVRRQADDPKTAMSELQAAVTEATGAALPEPVKLRRVSGRDIGTAALLLLAVGALVPMLAGIDFAAVWSVLQNASWGFVVVALAVGQTMFIPEAMGMLFAVGGRLPFWPLVALQVAAKFIGLAVPSVAGRVALNSAFLHKFGVGITVAVTQGAIDSFAGFAVEAAILILVFFSADIDVGFGSEDDVRWGAVLAAIAGLVIVGIGLLRIFGGLRKRIVPVVREAWVAVVDVLKEPGRALGLLGSNLATRLVMAAALWLVLEAIDAPLGLAACLVAVVATNLLQGIVPIPGGIGVTEAAMTAFLVALGVDENSAFAATITWRVITFYLPAVEGSFTMHWLERHEYL